MTNDIHTIPESSETESFSEKFHREEDSTLPSIEKSIKNLPKIKENLAPKPKKEVIKIHDPILVPKKKTTAETTDARWFNMKQPEMTPEIKRDLQIIKQRSALDPKRHYKKEKWEIPKYFQMGTIIEGNTEFYSARLTKKERGKTMVEELLHDDNTKSTSRGSTTRSKSQRLAEEKY
ncbi:rRNA-processing protein fcf2 [Candida viswanathii]|uniref:rRNA-processing protein fcf2 n=1 Tax=Candida viswanathii TaxID=5486 RepID=A0A367YIA5_9ASCO|nr:rRNA-processing protein fcf2 [Candida viswanathii]